jgi:hypothetical protein
LARRARSARDGFVHKQSSVLGFKLIFATLAAVYFVFFNLEIHLFRFELLLA